MANWLHSIKSKLLIFGLCISLIPIATVTNIYYFYARNVVEKQTLDALTAIAESRKSHILEFIEGRKARAEDFASDGFIRDSLEKINRGESLEQGIAIALNRHLLESKKPLDPSIERIDIVDLDGRIDASYHGPRIGTNLLEVDQHTTAYKRAISKNYTETCVGEPYYSHPQNVYSICVATPITSRSNNESLGMLINHYNLVLLNKITTNREGMGKTGEVYLVNSDGKMITESRFIEGALLKQVVDTEPVRRIAAGGGEMVGIYADYRGVAIVGVSMYLQKYGWILLAEIDKAEAFAPVKMLTVVAMILGLASAGVATVIGIIFAFSTSRPIRKLTDATRRFAGGDLKSRVSVTRKDEIGELADSFNVMASGLADEITERKCAEEELQQRILEMYSLNTLIQQVSTNLSLDQVVRAALEGIMSPVAPDLALLFVSEGDNLLLKRYQSSDPKFRHEETHVLRPGECLCGSAVKEGKPVYSYDINSDPRCTWEECKKAGLRSFAAFPLMAGEKILGVLGLASGTKKRDFSKQANFLEALANGITIGLQNAFLYEEVKQNEVELTKVNEDLKSENTERKRIEGKMAERTAELTEANASLEEKNREHERFNKVFVEREFRIKELRDRIKKLEKEKA